MNNDHIRPMRTEDCPVLVSLHRTYFGPSIINVFGEKFLLAAYEGMVEADWGKTLVYEDGGKLLGFVTVMFDARRFFLEILRKRWFVMGKETLKVVVADPSLLGNVLSAARYPNAFSADTKAEFLSLIVTEEARGTGIGGDLVNEVKRIFREKGFSRFKLGVKKNWEKAIEFHKKHGFEVIGEIDHGEEGMMFMIFDLTK